MIVMDVCVVPRRARPVIAVIIALQRVIGGKRSVKSLRPCTPTLAGALSLCDPAGASGGTVGSGLAAGICAWATPTNSVHVDALKRGHMISSNYAFCMAATQGHFTAAPDKNPRITWSKGPAGTKSYAIIMYDTNSPAEHREWMNQEGQTLTAAIQRRIFYHWLLVDIPVNVTSLAEGADSDARVAHGKQARRTRKRGNHHADFHEQSSRNFIVSSLTGPVWQC